MFIWLKVAAIWQFLTIPNVYTVGGLMSKRICSSSASSIALDRWTREGGKKEEKNACGNRSIKWTCSSALSSENRWSVCSTLTSTKSVRIIQSEHEHRYHTSLDVNDLFFYVFFFPFSLNKIRTENSSFVVIFSSSSLVYFLPNPTDMQEYLHQ